VILRFDREPAAKSSFESFLSSADDLDAVAESPADPVEELAAHLRRHA
jgi:ribosomal protein S18 acetylase RimI-like enzyme